MMFGKEPFKVQEEVKVTWCQVKAVKAVADLYPSKLDLTLSVQHRVIIHPGWSSLRLIIYVFHPSLNILTQVLTMVSLIALLPYISNIGL